MTVVTAKGLARALDVSVDYLIGTWDEDDAAPATRGRRVRRASRVG